MYQTQSVIFLAHEISLALAHLPAVKENKEILLFQGLVLIYIYLLF